MQEQTGQAEDVPEPVAAHKGSESAQVLVAIPALCLDAATLFFGERHLIFLAAGTADVTVPVLQDRQVVDWQSHEMFHLETRSAIRAAHPRCYCTQAAVRRSTPSAPLGVWRR